MFNANIPPTSLLGIESSTGLCSTPKTPEIVNSLIAMTNPMDNYNFSAINSAVSTPGSAVSLKNFNVSGTNVQISSQDSSHSSCSASPLNSPAGINTTPSVQQTCSQLIKAGLKLSIQSKRKLSTCDSSSGSEQPNPKCARREEDCEETTDDDSENKLTPKGLTPEDEDRRRRRRERNKIAATKCRMKKRERTQNLIKESEQLDTQNIDLKTQARVLETERRKLLEMLQAHSTTCIHIDGFNLPSKLLQSPAFKYITDLDLDVSCSIRNNNAISCAGTTINPITQSQAQQQQQLQMNSNQTVPQRTVIPPMSTIKFSRSNGFKAAAAVAASIDIVNAVATNQQLQQLSATQTSPLHQQPQLPNGYCKPSPTPQELGYVNSPSQENLCLPSLQSQVSANTPQKTSSAVNNQLSDYIPNCDNDLTIGPLTHTPTSVAVTNAGDNNALLSGVNGVSSPMAAVVISRPTTANDFVKNELVDSHSPYTTAQSAGRFLFENNCESYVDIKHAISLHPDSHNNNVANLSHSNNNNNILDFHSSLIASTGGITPIHDQISIKNDLFHFHEAELLAQLADDAGEFVDLDTGVATPFMTNGGCLA